MGKIKGVPVVLINKKESGYDPFGHPIFLDEEITIDNVLIVPASSDDIINQLNLTGKKAVYTLGIPKEDTHDWQDKEVLFLGKRWRTFGMPLEGIERMIPLDWNRKVMVERYE